MKKTVLLLLLCLSCVFVNKAYSQAKWTNHYEDSKVKIEYRIADCPDRVNDTDFSYYVLKIQNKTNKQLNVQFETSNSRNLLNKKVSEEDYQSFILKPSETREGNCTSLQKELKQLIRDNKKRGTSDDKQLVILNVKTYEL